MEHPVRSDVRVALCETHPALRSGFQAALYRRGLRDMEVCKDSASLLKLLQTQIIDLVICATDLPGLDFFDMMQQIRHGTIGRNPFTLVLATVGEATVDDIRRVVNAGVDRVVRKPMSMAEMVSCVNALAISRKPFVATDSYVGPSRRAAGRSDQAGDEVMDVPNTLAVKLNGGMAESRLENLIDKGLDGLSHLCIHNSCLAVWRSVQRVVWCFQHHGRGRVGAELSHLQSMSEAIERRYRDTPHAHLAEVAVSLALLVELLVTTPPEEARSLSITVELLHKLGEVIRLADQSDPRAVATVQAIARSIRRFANGLTGDAALAAFGVVAQAGTLPLLS